MTSLATPPVGSLSSDNNSDSSSASPELELKRESAWPQYLPSTGVGSKMRESGPGVIQNGIETTRQNTPAGSTGAPTPANEHAPALSSYSNVDTLHPQGNGSAPTAGNQEGRSLLAKTLSHTRDGHTAVPGSEGGSLGRNDTKAAANHDFLQTGHTSSTNNQSNSSGPSYFPPFVSASTPVASPTRSQSSGTSTNGTGQTSAHKGTDTPAHRIPSPIAEGQEEDDSAPRFDINAFNALGTDLSNLKIEGLTVVSGDTDVERAPSPSPAGSSNPASILAEQLSKAASSAPSALPSTSTEATTPAPSILAQHAKQLESTGTKSLAVANTVSPHKPEDRSRSSSISASNNATSAASSNQSSPTKHSSTASPAASQTHLQPPLASSGHATTQHSNTQAHPQRPAPEQKKSMFGKLFHKDKPQSYREESPSTNGTSGGSSSMPNEALPSSTRATSGSRERATSSNRSTTRDRGYSSGAHSGAESDYTNNSTTGASSATTAPSMVRRPSANAVPQKEREGAGGIGSFFGRRMSNKKMPTPDPSLLNMKTATGDRESTSSRASPAASTVSVHGDVTPSPGASTVTVGGQRDPTGRPTASHQNSYLASSTAASRGSTPDLASMPASQARQSAPSPSRQPTSDNTESLDRSTTKRPSALEQKSQSHLRANGTSSGTHTPSSGGTDPKHQVSQKSLKEHLAALGSSTGMGMGIGKLGRKASQTSRKSDDGRSEKSAYHPDDSIPPVPTLPTDGSSYNAPPIKRAPSVGGVSNASTSLAQKYGYCEKTAIGKGATAIVRLAHKWDRSTEKLYAVKEFRKRRKNESEKEYVKKLTSEFCISSTLHHVNIVETVDLVQNEEKHWCEVMEYCSGGDLYAAIKKGTMTAEDSNLYFKQIVTGVAYLHTMGVAHRDIKPENLLLDGSGVIKITDFGVSDVFRMCWEKQTHMSKGLCGSEPYIAPEQFEHKEYDARLVDVWATAVVFYCMQAQELPWRVAKPSDPSFASYLQYYPASTTPPPLGNLYPHECRTLIKKMLDPNPKTRIHMDAILADPWMKGIDYNPPPESSSSLTSK